MDTYSQEEITRFQHARRLAVKEYERNVSKGQSGYLPFLEGLLKNVEIISEVDLGTIEIPLKKVVGTYSYARSLSFASNFMPLLNGETEFSQKWMNLCNAHLEEGIRDPIKVYEYLNWFYVVEGNKRVSVLKYFQAYSVSGRVARLIPKRDDGDIRSRIYYEFLAFNKETRINCIWFSRENSFNKLLEYLREFEPAGVEYAEYKDKCEYFANSIYLAFRRIYHEIGGGQLPITTGDAFLEYIKVYGIPNEIDEEDVKPKLKLFMTELERLSDPEAVDVQTEPFHEKESRLFSTITTLVKPKRKIKVAFVHAKTAQKSNWTYAHELGRQHVEKVMGEYVETSCVDSVPESMKAYDDFKKLAEDGNDIIFGTSPAFINATLKAALEYRNVRFLNCSETNSFRHVNTYFGRIYEPRFLAGIIAGAVTQSDVLGYVGTYPVHGVISGINSFALGARLVNPRVKVHVAWTNQWETTRKAKGVSDLLVQQGADIISHQNTLANRNFYKEFGLYSMVCSTDKKLCSPSQYIAAPMWNWGIFYERIIRNVMNDTWKTITDLFGAGLKHINFWWGMDAGVVDILYSVKHVPRETQKLVNFMKKMIESHAFNPFTGPIYDQKGKLRIEPEEAATYEQILAMDWFVDVVETEMPELYRIGVHDELLSDMMEEDSV